MTEKEALKLALDFVASISPAFICEATHHKKNERHADNEPCPHVAKQKATYEAIKEALAQPKKEPVAWVSSEELLVMRGNALGGAKDWRINVGLVKQNGDVGLYTIPPQRTWVGLTEAQCGVLWKTNMTPFEYYQAIEAKLKEKNT
jgi:hypothetical protein